MQASTSWTPPTGTLGAIVGETTERVMALRARAGELRRALAHAPAPVPFAAALRGARLAVIAEVKRRSPSRGTINAGLDAPSQAAAYAAGGAAAISVLTEPTHFGGSNDDLRAVRDLVRIPVLKKDFHLDPVQLLEARVLGASAALLIARAIHPAALAGLVDEARGLGLETLVEVRSEAELEGALAAGAGVVGVNCRDLQTLEMDARVAEWLVARIPPGVIAVWESGIATPADVEHAAASGADAVLVGSAVSAASDPAQAVRALAAIQRRTGIRG
ncbi:MAG TPA: indole-3-glycerol-phosphate synthase [Gemmatimonadaceae bacterium]|nr:indole-3-glycerol-phosphate synthase [Gemmatimonadaceae bacterium]